MTVLSGPKADLDSHITWTSFRGADHWLLTSPRFHHWHHADSPEAIDKNFAVLLPLWDVLFGTALWRREWPASYGLAGEQMPETYIGQCAYPFALKQREEFAPAGR